MGHQDIDEGFSADLGESRIVFHHRCRGHLAAQGAAFDDSRLQAAALEVDTGGQPGRSAADNHHVGFHMLGVHIGDKHGLLLHFEHG